MAVNCGKGAIVAAGSEPPADAIESLEPEAAGRAADAPLPNGWLRFRSDDRGADYFYNCVTGVTQWESPTESWRAA